MLEIVVIGGGIAGFSVALALWERGSAVTIVEASRPGAEATGASAGVLAAQWELPGPTDKFRLCLESRRRWPAHAARLEELCGRSLHVRWDGILVANLSEPEHAGAIQTVRWQSEAGLRATLVDAGEAQRLQPGLSPAVTSYLWLPDEGRLDAQVLADALGTALARTGIRLIAGNAVAEIRSQGGVAVGVTMKDGRRLEAERVVLAAGAHSATVAGLPRPLPVRPVRGQILRFKQTEPPLRRPVGSHAGRYLVPREDGTVLAGSTMEEVGFDRSITEGGRRTIHESVTQLVPGMAGKRPLEHWAGLRPLSADASPILGPEPELDGLYYAAGYGRDGILVAPLVGAIVADLITTGKSDYDWRPFRADRFAAPAR
jgi:glycine oxidase